MNPAIVAKDWPKTTSAFALSPLTPTLSPEYQGEGVIFRPWLTGLQFNEDGDCALLNRVRYILAKVATIRTADLGRLSKLLHEVVFSAFRVYLQSQWTNR